MAKKIMIMPSARSKFIKDKNMRLIYISLIVLTIVMVFLNYYMYSFMYGVKLALMVLVAIIATVETEILFYSHDKDIERKEAKDLIQKSYPKLTAIMYALLIPVGTPLWLVGLGAVLATLLGKLLFGGFHHMIFHSSIVGVIFVTMGWPQLVDSVAFMTSFDNYLIDLIFNNSFFNDTLAIGGMFDPANMTDVLESLSMGNGSLYEFTDVMFGVVPGVIGSGLVVIGIFGYLIAKKAINWITPVSMIASFLVIGYIITFVNDLSMTFPIYHLFSGSLLFVAVFIGTDPITTPVESKGKILFGVVAGALAMVIRNAAQYEEGVYFAILFMMMLTPMINQSMKKKPKKKPVIKKEAV